jgi:hypothetical protein
MRLQRESGRSQPTFILSMVALVVLSGLLAYGAFATYDISSSARRVASANAQIDAQTLPLEQLPHSVAVTADILSEAKAINANLQPVLHQSQRSAGLSGQILGYTNQVRPLVVRAAQLSGNILALNQQVESTATRTRTVAKQILGVNQAVQRDVGAINRNLAVTIAIAHEIRADTANILGQTRRTLHLNACIDREAHGPDGQNGDCIKTRSSR